MKKHKFILVNLVFCVMFVFGTSTALAAEKPRWGKIHHKCTTGDQGKVWAKLKGVKFGKKMKTCKAEDGNTPPAMSAYGLNRAPDVCKRKVTGVYGYWNISNDALCEDGKKDHSAEHQPYWDKSKHWCASPGVGKVEARLLGVGGSPIGKKQRKFDICESSNSPTLDVLGASGRPTWCQKRLVHVYGRWTINDDVRCQPKWKKVKAKGCLGPDTDNGGTSFRQVYRAKIKKLKNGGQWWETKKWKWPLSDTQRAWARDACLNQDHPDENRGKPDYCKVQAGVWAYWYKDVELCEKPLKWAKFKDNGCVADMEEPDLSGGYLDATGKRSYSAKLKYVKGDRLEACATWPMDGAKAKDGTTFDVEHPTGCVLKNLDGAVTTTISLGVAVAGAAATGGATTAMAVSAKAAMAAAGGTSLLTFGGTEWLLNAADTTHSVEGIVWVDDASCR